MFGCCHGLSLTILSGNVTLRVPHARQLLKREDDLVAIHSNITIHEEASSPFVSSTANSNTPSAILTVFDFMVTPPPISDTNSREDENSRAHRRSRSARCHCHISRATTPQATASASAAQSGKIHPTPCSERLRLRIPIARRLLIFKLTYSIIDKVLELLREHGADSAK